MPRIPVTAKEIFKFRREYITKRNLITWSFYNFINPIEVVNIILTHDLSVTKTVVKKVDLTKLHVISIADLIKMKQTSNRPQNIEDVKVLKRLS